MTSSARQGACTAARRSLQRAPSWRPGRMADTVPLWAGSMLLSGTLAQGYTLNALLDRLQVPEDARHDPQTRISMDRFSALLERLSREMRDEFIGLCSTPAPLGTFATVMRQLLYCPTLREALQLALRLYHLAAPGLKLRVQPMHGGLVRLEVRDHGAPSVIAFQSVATYWLLSMARWLVDQPIPVRQAWMHKPAEDARYREIEPFLEVPAVYDSPFTGVAIDAHWLQRPLAQGPAGLAGFLAAAPANLLRRHRNPASVVEQVQSMMRTRPQFTLPTLRDVAHALGTSPRSLRRRLTDEGCSFQGLKDLLRHEAAVTWLAHSELSLAEIGDRLGYSDASTFHRAFKRWTGAAPGEFRRTGSA